MKQIRSESEANSEEELSKRISQSNPNWNTELGWEPGRVSGVMVVHVPHLEDYYSDMMEVLDRSLSSWADPMMDRIVYLNGCCPDIQALVRSHKPDIILESAVNVGAINALFQAVRLAPGEIIAYSDYDVEYRWDWLPAQLQVLQAFPLAGMVSGNAAGWSAEHCNASAKGLPGKWKKQEPEALKQWAASVKWNWDKVRARAEVDEQWHTRMSGVPAIVGAKHYQFVAYRSRLLEVDPGFWPHPMKGHVPVLDEAIDAAGYQRLSVVEPVVFHLGNRLVPGV